MDLPSLYFIFALYRLKSQLLSNIKSIIFCIERMVIVDG